MWYVVFDMKRHAARSVGRRETPPETLPRRFKRIFSHIIAAHVAPNATALAPQLTHHSDDPSAITVTETTSCTSCIGTPKRRKSLNTCPRVRKPSSWFGTRTDS